MQTQGAALDADLGWALGVVFRSYVKAVESVVSDLPGGPRGYQVLASAAEGRADNQVVLSQQLGIDRTVLTYLIDDLEQVGLVERRADPLDRRSRRITATAKGTDVFTQRRAALRHVEAHLLGCLGADADTFRMLLRRLSTQANEFDPVAGACEVVDQLNRLDEPLTPRRGRRRQANSRPE
jgi:DNA-binding MarR family transcriptional regulator